LRAGGALCLHLQVLLAGNLFPLFSAHALANSAASFAFAVSLGSTKWSVPSPFRAASLATYSTPLYLR
jgi:hypothetical protein